MRKFQSGSLNTRVCRFLYNYRKTEHSGVKESPAEMLFGRKFKSSLDICRTTKEKEEESRLVTNAKPLDCSDSEFVVGQAVFAKNYGRGKQWLPGVIEEVKGARNYVVKVFTETGSLFWRRHSDQLKTRFNTLSNFDYETSNCQHNEIPTVTNDFVPIINSNESSNLG